MYDYKTEHILSKIGGHHTYQFLLTLIFFMMGISIDYYFFYQPLMETPPIVGFQSKDGENIVSIVNYEICANHNFTILTELSKSTIILDYDFFCDKFKTSIYGLLPLLGSLAGTIFINYFSFLGNKTCIIICNLLIIIVTPFLFIHNFYLMLAVNFFFGFGVITSFILRNSMLTEVSDSKFRSYFLNINISSGTTSYIIYFFIFTKNIHWIYVYSGNALLLLVSITIFCLYSVNSPNFYINKEDETSKNKLNASCEYIAWVNCKSIPKQDCLNSISDSEVNIITQTQISQDTLEFSSEMNFKQKYKLWIFIFTFIAFITINISVTLELKFYGNELNNYFYLFSLATYLSYYFFSTIMNMKFFGRRYANVLALTLVVILKLFKVIMKNYYDKILFQNFYTILYLTTRLMIYSCQIPIQTLVVESFSNKERVKSYSKLYLSAKVLTIFTPMALEYFSVNTYDIFIICLACFIIFMIVNCIDETLNKKIKD